MSKKKYLKKLKKKQSQPLPMQPSLKAQHFPSVVGLQGATSMSGGMPTSMSAPLLQHYQYKSRFQLIPMRQNQPTILLHHPCHPSHLRYAGHGRHRHHKSRRGSSDKNAFFSNCWPL